MTTRVLLTILGVVLILASLGVVFQVYFPSDPLGPWAVRVSGRVAELDRAGNELGGFMKPWLDGRKVDAEALDAAFERHKSRLSPLAAEMKEAPPEADVAAQALHASLAALAEFELGPGLEFWERIVAGVGENNPASRADLAVLRDELRPIIEEQMELRKKVVAHQKHLASVRGYKLQ